MVVTRLGTRLFDLLEEDWASREESQAELLPGSSRRSPSYPLRHSSGSPTSPSTRRQSAARLVRPPSPARGHARKGCHDGASFGGSDGGAVEVIPRHLPGPLPGVPGRRGGRADPRREAGVPHDGYGTPALHPKDVLAAGETPFRPGRPGIRARTFRSLFSRTSRSCPCPGDRAGSRAGQILRPRRPPGRRAVPHQPGSRCRKRVRRASTQSR